MPIPNYTSDHILKLPGIGGIVAIAYCMLWLAIYSISLPFSDEVILVIVGLLILPLGVLFYWIPPLANIYPILFCIVLGINSFIWGYLIQWLVNAACKAHRR